MKLPVIAICAAGLAAAQTQPLQPLPKWVLDLSRIKRQARDNFGRLPNYVCLETMDRFVKRPDRAWEKIDTVAFEVASIDHKEFFGLVGASHFEFDNLLPFIGSGFIGTGSFSSTVSNLFLSDNARFTWSGEDHALVRTALRYHYDIPAMLSGFNLEAAGKRATVGVRGTFWADAKSLDILRIEEHAVDVPVELNMRDVDSSIDYDRVRIGQSAVLLPKSAEQVMTDFTGGQARNVTVFSGCREFTSESLIHFEAPAPGQAERRPPPPPAKK